LGALKKFRIYISTDVKGSPRRVTWRSRCFSGKQRPAAKVTRKQGGVNPLRLQLTGRTIGALQLMGS
jgi:hypothetical protein